MRGNDPQPARMRLRFGQRSVFGLRGRVGADRHERMDQRRADVLLVHDREDAIGLAAVGDDEIHQRIARVLAHAPSDLGQRHALRTAAARG